MTTGEHADHDPPHPVSEITGNISGNCSSNVFINNIACAYVGSITSEFDICTNGSGSVSQGSPNVFVNNKAVARLNDATAPHNGSAKIIQGSPNVFAN